MPMKRNFDSTFVKTRKFEPRKAANMTIDYVGERERERECLGNKIIYDLSSLFAGLLKKRSQESRNHLSRLKRLELDWAIIEEL